jgi:hypothetical protein
MQGRSLCKNFVERVTMDEEGVPIFFTKGFPAEVIQLCIVERVMTLPPPPPFHGPIKKNKHGRISGFNWRARTNLQNQNEMVASVRPPNGTESTILVVALYYNVPVWSSQGE